MAKKVLGEKAIYYPLPVVLVGCADREGKPNLFTCAWTGRIADDLVYIVVNKGNLSYYLITEGWEFTVNMPTADLVEKVDRCGTISGRAGDKFKAVGLTAVPSTKVKPPMVGECPISMECVTTHALPVGPYRMFIGKVVAAHADESVLTPEGKLDAEKLNALSFLDAVGRYASVTKLLGREGFSKSQ